MTDLQLHFAVGVPSMMAVLSIGVNVALYIHLSSTMSTRFAAVDTRLELMMAKIVEIDNRVIRLEERFGIKE